MWICGHVHSRPPKLAPANRFRAGAVCGLAVGSVEHCITLPTPAAPWWKTPGSSTRHPRHLSTSTSAMPFQALDAGAITRRRRHSRGRASVPARSTIWSASRRPYVRAHGSRATRLAAPNGAAPPEAPPRGRGTRRRPPSPARPSGASESRSSGRGRRSACRSRSAAGPGAPGSGTSPPGAGG